MKTIIYLVLSLFLTCNFIYGQKSLIKAKSFEEAFEFSKAIEYYKKTLKGVEKLNYSQKADLFLGLGNCYMSVNDYENAKLYYLQCLENDYNTKQTFFNIGLAFLGLCDYENAIIAFTKSTETNFSDPINPTCKNFRYHSDLDVEAFLKIDMCEKAMKGSDIINGISVINMRQFNTAFSEFGVYYSNGYLFFASMKKNLASKTDQRTLQGLSDIFYSSFEKTNSIKKNKNKEKYLSSESNYSYSWADPVALPYPFNNPKYNEGTLAIDFVNQISYVMQCTGVNGECKIISINLREKFSGSEVQPININNNIDNFGHPCLNSDGSVLYFVSDMPGGYGGTDIWVCFKNIDGSWSEPENLGSNINTSCDEMFPSLFNDSLIIFSSTGHKGYGGLDLFYSNKLDDGKFSPCINFGLPINSGADDFSMFYAKDLKGGLFCSNRPGGAGSDDIYYYSGFPFSLIISGIISDKSNGKPITSATIIVSSGISNDTLYSNNEGMYSYRVTPGISYIMEVYKNGFSQNFRTISININNPETSFRFDNSTSQNQNFELIPNPSGVAIEGIVTEKSTNSPLSGQSMILLGKDGFLDVVVTDDVGRYSFTNISDNNSYILMLASKGFWTRTKVLDIPKLSRPKTFSSETGYNFNFEAIEIPQNQEIIIYNIFYEYNKANIMKGSEEELNKIVTLLKENPNLKVEISAHADERGSEEYNNILTQKRAQSVVEYLISNGIDKTRLVAKGYGKRYPVISNAKTEEEHQMNRRTAFKIITIDDQNIGQVIESVMPKVNTKQIMPSTNDPNNSAIIYKVQIMASRVPINNSDYFSELQSQFPEITIQEVECPDGWYRYFAGSFKLINEAVILRDMLRKNGFPDCFISIVRSN